MNCRCKKAAIGNRVKWLCLFVVSCVLLVPEKVHAVYNVVWQDDFGVVEDSVVRGFANPNMSMPGYILAVDGVFMKDGRYAIMNSTKWSFIRKGDKTEEQHFFAGRDHTGNPNGAMLVVNGAARKDVVYEYNVETKMCEKRKYRFSMYSASISNYEPPIFTLQVLNVKDAKNPKILKSYNVPADNVPRWEQPDEKDDKGRVLPHVVQNWGKSSVEFVAGAGDKIQIRILNDYDNSTGNDFVIDDIMLERDDEYTVEKPNIVASSSSSCMPTYSVKNTSLLKSWKKIYDKIYFLWQYSTDDGYTWKTISGASGVEKTSMERERPKKGSEVYRLVVTGGSSAAEAQKKAEEYAKYGTLNDGCDYISVSDIISQLDDKPTPKASVGIDSDSKKSQSAYDCSKIDHVVKLFADEWDKNFSKYVFMWQYSSNGKTWKDYSVKSKLFVFDDSFEGLTYFRAILATDNDVLKQVAKNGKADNDCAKYYITDKVSIECHIPCQIAKFKPAKSEQIICSDQKTAVNLSAIPTNTAKVDKREWYVKSDNKKAWSLLKSTTDNSISVDNPGRTSWYGFVAKFENCVSDTIKFKLTVNEAIKLDQISDVSVCEGTDVDLSAKVLSGSPTTYIWNEKSSAKAGYTLKEVQSDQQVSLYATDDVCVSNKLKIGVSVEKKAEVTLGSLPPVICEGTSVNLEAKAKLGSANAFAWKRNGVLLSDKDLNLVDAPTDDATYTFSVTGDKCPVIEEEVATKVEHTATLALSVSESEVCEGTEVVLSVAATHAPALVWKQKLEGESDYKVLDESGEKVTITALKNADYQVSTTGELVCESVTSNQVSVGVEKIAGVELEPLPEMICDGSSVKLVANAQLSDANTFSWSKGGAVITNSELVTSVVPEDDATYLFTVNGIKCPVIEKEVSTKVEKKSVVGVVASAPVVCQGNPVVLSSDYPYVAGIVWESKGVDEEEFHVLESGSNEVVHSPLVNTMYRVSATSKLGCIEIGSETEVLVDEPAELQVEDVVICEGEVAHLEASTNRPYDRIEWRSLEQKDVIPVYFEPNASMMLKSASSSWGTILSDTTVLEVSPESTSTYNVIVYRGVCVEDMDANVRVVEIPHIVAHEDLHDHAYQMIVGNVVEPVSFDYGNGEGKTTSDILRNVRYGKTYEVEISNDFGCKSTYLLQVPPFNLEFPRFFFQGEENWVVGNLDRYTNTTMFIYNRYGKLLFEMKDAVDGWNGEYHGNDLPSTDYWYVIDLPEVDTQFTGHFTLLRR
ncbi:MAG: T9SS type B sorting domain-containing protein [Paludibacteraceae bacterium]|nr:T9SS type B sorting domain-containing protein [Paludibacteraceae bacterium]